jgi:hypothetical protein
MIAEKDFENELRTTLFVVERHAPAPPDLAERLIAGMPPHSPPREARGRSWRPWLGPLAAALAVVAIAVGSLAVADGHRSSHSTSQSPAASSQSVKPAPSSGVTKKPAPAPVVSGPWGLHLISHQPVDQAPLVSDGTSLFSVTGKTISLIDPKTGTVVRQLTDADLGSSSGNVVVVGGVLVYPVMVADNQVELRRFDARRLAPLATWTFDASISRTVAIGRGELMVAVGPGPQLYLNTGDDITVIGADSGGVTGHIAIDGQLSSLDVSPDGRTLYAAVYPGQTNDLLDAAVRTYALPSGQLIATAPASTSGAIRDLLATDGGVFGLWAGGHVGELNFLSRSDLATLQPVNGMNQAGAMAETLAHDTAWFTGASRLACSDPNTGRLRASVTAPSHAGGTFSYELTGIVEVNGEFFTGVTAIEGSQPAVTGIARISPPKACFG